LVRVPELDADQRRGRQRKQMGEIQFWYADQGGIHLFWYLPLLMLLVFRPNLLDRRAPVIQPDTDWLHRFGRTLGGHAIKLLHLPHPPVQVG